MIPPCQGRKSHAHNQERRIQESPAPRFRRCLSRQCLSRCCLPRYCLPRPDDLPDGICSGDPCEEHPRTLYDPCITEEQDLKDAQPSFFLPAPVTDCKGCHSQKGQQKIYQKTVDPDRQVQIEQDRAPHCQERIEQEAASLHDDAEDREKACEDQAVLGKQHNPLGMPGVSADIIDKKTAPRRIVPKRNQLRVHTRKLICGKQIFYDQRPVGKIIVMDQFQIQCQPDEHRCPCGKTDPAEAQSRNADLFPAKQNEKGRSSCKSSQHQKIRSLFQGSRQRAAEEHKADSRHGNSGDKPYLHLAEPEYRKKVSPHGQAEPGSFHYISKQFHLFPGSFHASFLFPRRISMFRRTSSYIVIHGSISRGRECSLS